ncbi:hypothetical protein [Saccharopolyspora phatthalungensis]|uniref:Cas3 C-terminal domain-containing protein n=1 Tax=Saccharopolyspora phatthalungensis TaxID=664693 RepID=A0A840Q9E2_9PSEU|nr:hypothetical protein [Saccharopolyspora phatthalungensis]MBB5157384.1 hypothetical protein [Saccharopolyspora phatthalungensis]
MTFTGHDDQPSPFEDSITLVPLWTTDQDLPVSRHGTPVDLDAIELPEATAVELAASVVHLTVPDDLSPDAFAALIDLAVPECFAESDWLTDHRPLILRDGHCTLGPLTFYSTAEGDLLMRERSDGE